jgi:hypothetical protein
MRDFRKILEIDKQYLVKHKRGTSQVQIRIYRVISESAESAA